MGELNLSLNFSPYRIVDVLGQGGMAKVFLAFDPRLNRKVAIKTLKPRCHKENFAQLVQEARVISQLQHPNIIHLYDVIEKGNEVVALVMEYVSGGTLAERMQLTPTGLSEADALPYMKQLLRALQAAHKLGIVHRDIKPENVLIDANGQLKLSDFGISSLLGLNNEIIDKAQNGQVTGSADYLSPELACGKVPDQRSDIFSLGILFYWLLSGRQAFGGLSLEECMSNIVYKEAEPLSVFVPAIDRNLETLICQMLEKNPAQRPATAEEVWEKIDHLRSEKISSQDTRETQVVGKALEEITPTETAAKPCKKLTKTGFAVAASAIFSLAIFISTWLPTDETIRYLAISPPEILGDSPSAAAVKASVFYTLYDSVSRADNIHLIDFKNTREVQNLGLKGIHKALAVDEIVHSELVCGGLSCQLLLSHSMRDSDSERFIQTGRKIDLRADDLLGASDIVHALVIDLGIVEAPVSKGGQVWREADFESFVNIWSHYVHGSLTSDLILELENLIKLNRLFLPAEYLLSDVYHEMYLQSRNDQWLEKHLTLLQTLDQSFPERYPIKKRLLDNALAQNANEASLDLIEWLKNNNSASPETLYYQARIQFNLGNIEQSLALFSQLVEYQANWKNLDTYALYLLDAGEFQLAEEVVKELLRIYPGYSRGRALNADLLFLQGKVREAIAAYKSLDDYENNYATLANIGLCHILLAEYTESMLVFEQALKLGSETYEANLNLADVLVLAGQSERAQSHYRKVTTLLEHIKDASNWRPFAARAQAQARLGYYQSAVDDIQQALQLASRDAELAFQAFIVFSLVGDNVSATVFEQKAKNLGVAETWFQHDWF